MTSAEAQAAVKKYGSIRKAAAALHLSRRSLGRLVGGEIVKKSEHIGNKTGRSLSEFKLTYDKDTIVPAKVKAGLKELGASWEYEAEFIRRCGVTFADLGNYREKFAEHLVVIRQDSKRVWAGTVGLAKQLKGMLA